MESSWLYETQTAVATFGRNCRFRGRGFSYPRILATRIRRSGKHLNEPFLSDDFITARRVLLCWLLRAAFIILPPPSFPFSFTHLHGLFIFTDYFSHYSALGDSGWFIVRNFQVLFRSPSPILTHDCAHPRTHPNTHTFTEMATSRLQNNFSSFSLPRVLSKWGKKNARPNSPWAMRS